MRIRYHFNTLPLLVLLGTAAAADAQVQPKLAQRWFEEATKLCERDAGRLWGVSLCGPMVIVDQATGTRATSQPEPEGSHLAFQVSRTAPSRRARLDAAGMAGAPPGARVERERPVRGDRRCAGLQTRAPPPVSRRGGQR